jgi:hypothetical protein
MKTNLKSSEVSFLLDLMDCTIQKGSLPKDISKYEKWNNVDSIEVYKELMRMLETE